MAVSPDATAAAALPGDPAAVAALVAEICEWLPPTGTLPGATAVAASARPRGGALTGNMLADDTRRASFLARLRGALLSANASWSTEFDAADGFALLCELLAKFIVSGHLTTRDALEFMLFLTRLPAGLAHVASSERVLGWVVSLLASDRSQVDNAVKVLDILHKVVRGSPDGPLAVVKTFAEFAVRQSRDPWLLLGGLRASPLERQAAAVLKAKLVNFCESLLERAAPVRVVDELCAAFARAQLLDLPAGYTPGGTSSATAASGNAALASPSSSGASAGAGSGAFAGGNGTVGTGTGGAGGASGSAAPGETAHESAAEQLAELVMRFRAGIKTKRFTEMDAVAVLRGSTFADTTSDALAVLERLCVLGVVTSRDRGEFDLVGFEKIDPSGRKRGACTANRECHVYVRPASGASCEFCGHKPTSHHLVREGMVFGSITAGALAEDELTLVSLDSPSVVALVRSGGAAPVGPGEASTLVPPGASPRALGWLAWNQRDVGIAKILLVGPAGAGKSALTARLAGQPFVSGYEPTLGAKFAFTLAETPNGIVLVQLWDCAGREGYSLPPRALYAGARGVLLVFDLTSDASFAAVRSHWLADVTAAAPRDAVVVVVGNKDERVDVARVSAAAASAAAKSAGYAYMETSARFAHRVAAPVHFILARLGAARAGSSASTARAAVSRPSATAPPPRSASSGSAAAGTVGAAAMTTGAAAPATRLANRFTRFVMGGGASKEAPAPATDPKRAPHDAMGDSCSVQ